MSVNGVQCLLQGSIQGLLAKLHILLATSLVRVVVSVQPVNGRLDWQSIIIKSLIQRYF